MSRWISIITAFLFTISLLDCSSCNLLLSALLPGHLENLGIVCKKRSLANIERFFETLTMDLRGQTLWLEFPEAFEALNFLAIAESVTHQIHSQRHKLRAFLERSVGHKSSEHVFRRLSHTFHFGGSYLDLAGVHNLQVGVVVLIQILAYFGGLLFASFR